MSDYTGFKEIGVGLDGMVATVEIRRPPHNFFDSALIAEIGEAFERLDADSACRTIVLAAEGRSFCAGADFSKRMDTGTVQESARSGGGRHLYKEAIRLFRTKKPIIGAIHGAAVRGGLVDQIEAATERELVEQDCLRRTEDFQEGIKAYADRRLPDFKGR